MEESRRRRPMFWEDIITVIKSAPQLLPVAVKPEEIIFKVQKKLEKVQDLIKFKKSSRSKFSHNSILLSEDAQYSE